MVCLRTAANLRRRVSCGGFVVRLLSSSLLVLFLSLLTIWLLRSFAAPLVQSGANPLTSGGWAGLAAAISVASLAIIRERPR